VQVGEEIVKMKLSEKGLRQLIKEELALEPDVNEEEEGSEVTRDAIESNLHDETIVRFFEALGIDETETLPPETATGAEGFATGLETAKDVRSGAGIDPTERAMIGNLQKKLVASAKQSKITSGVVRRYMELLARVLDKIVKLDSDATGETTGAAGATTSAAIQEEIVSKVIEEIFKKKQ